MKDLQQYYKEHESRYGEDKILTRGREDGTRNVPDPDHDECSPYEMEMLHACSRLASKIAGAYRSKLEELDAQIKAEKDLCERKLVDSTERAENIHTARKAALDDNHELADARKHLDVAENRYNMMHTKLGRAPIEYCPHWLYVIFAFLIFAGEIPLNAIVFQIFGEAQVMTWIMAFVVGLAVPVSAHFIGIKAREHQGKFSIPNALKALAIFGIVVGALYGLSVMRQTYLGEFKEELGLTDMLVQSSILFFWLNVAVLCAAVIVAYLSHDPVPGYQKMEAEFKKARKLVQHLERARVTKSEQIGLERTRLLDEARTEYREGIRSVHMLMGEYDAVLRDGQEEESRCVDRLGQELSIYRHENLTCRQDKKTPKAFSKQLTFPLELTKLPEKLVNETGNVHAQV